LLSKAVPANHFGFKPMPKPAVVTPFILIKSRRESIRDSIGKR